MKTWPLIFITLKTIILGERESIHILCAGTQSPNISVLLFTYKKTHKLNEGVDFGDVKTDRVYFVLGAVGSERVQN